MGAQLPRDLVLLTIALTVACAGCKSEGSGDPEGEKLADHRALPEITERKDLESKPDVESPISEGVLVKEDISEAWRASQDMLKLLDDALSIRSDYLGDTITGVAGETGGPTCEETRGQGFRVGCFVVKRCAEEPTLEWSGCAWGGEGSITLAKDGLAKLEATFAGESVKGSLNIEKPKLRDGLKVTGKLDAWGTKYDLDLEHKPKKGLGGKLGMEISGGRLFEASLEDDVEVGSNCSCLGRGKVSLSGDFTVESTGVPLPLGEYLVAAARSVLDGVEAEDLAALGDKLIVPVDTSGDVGAIFTGTGAAGADDGCAKPTFEIELKPGEKLAAETDAAAIGAAIQALDCPADCAAAEGCELPCEVLKKAHAAVAAEVEKAIEEGLNPGFASYSVTFVHPSIEEILCKILHDSDDDGTCDPNDNCPQDANADQRDTDFDGVGNACDADDDGDGVADDDDCKPTDKRAPSCKGKQCGDDGCGGDCGTCPGVATCENGKCEHGDVDTAIADVSADPVRIEISGKGSFLVHGLSRIGWDIGVIERDMGNGTSQKSLGNVVVPDITLTGVRAESGYGVRTLKDWIEEPAPGGFPDAKDAWIFLEGVDGEKATVLLYSILPKTGPSDPTITMDRGQEVLAKLVLEIYEHYDLTGSPHDLLDVRDLEGPPVLYPCPAPGDYVEIDGVDLGTAGCSNTNRHVQAACWGEGELKWPATGSSEAVYLTNLRQGWSAYDWMRDISDAAAENRFPTKRHISIVGFDASCDETRRLNVFEAWPARIHVFNPTKPYGETPLVDILIVNNWNELSR